MTSPHKIVINVDIGMQLTWFTEKLPQAKGHRNYSILKEKVLGG